MSQQNYKMMAIVDRNYYCLDELRAKYGSFNSVIGKLLEVYYTKAEMQEKIDHE
jgi:hypothetical protein